MTWSVFIRIGNSDNKLAQIEWSKFVASVRQLVNETAQRCQGQVHGDWLSPTDAPWQNACWEAEVNADGLERLRGQLAILAGAYGQDSIAFSVATTEFIAGRLP